jgi:hypothetical protein
MRALLLIAPLLLGAAQSTGKVSPTSDVSSSRVTSTGSTTALPLKDWAQTITSTAQGASAYKVTGGTADRTDKDRWADVVNVKDFGAVGNGVADDTAAINATVAAALALAAGAPVVYLPRGVYRITAPIVATGVQGSATVGVILRGAGEHATYIRVDADTATDAIQFHKATLYGTGGGVEDLAIRAAGDLRTKYRHGISFRKWYSAQVTNVRMLHAGGDGVRIFDSFDLVFTRAVIQSSDYGVYVESGGEIFPTTLRFMNCYTSQTQRDGFNIWAATSVFIGTIAEKAGEAGVANAGAGIKIRSGNAYIASCHFEANLGHDVWIGTFDDPQYRTSAVIEQCYHYTAGLKTGGYVGVFFYRASGGTVIGGHYQDFVEEARRPIKIGNSADAKHVRIISPTGMTGYIVPQVALSDDTPVALQDYDGIIEYVDETLDVVTGNFRVEPKAGIRLGGSGATMTAASAAPTTGAHVQGEIVWNTAPSAGGPIGWACTTTGTPGTWKAMANLAP